MLYIKHGGKTTAPVTQTPSTYHGAGAEAHGEDVLKAGGENVPRSVLHGHDVERSGVPE